MLTIYQRSVAYRKTRQVPEFQKSAWIHLEKPTEDELKTASETLKVELGHLKDALDPYEAPRLEMEKEGVYTFVRYPHNESTRPLLIVVAKEGVLTISQEPNPIIDRFLSGDVDFYTTQKARFVLLILSEINKGYTGAMATIRKEINRSKTSPDKMTSKDIVKLVSYESTVGSYVDALIPQQAVLNKILLGKTFNVPDEDEDLAEDLVLSTNQLIDAGRAALRTMVNIRSAYTAISTERLNIIIRRLTALTVLLTVPTVITSFYGMNVMLPAQDTPLAPYAIFALIIAIVGVLLYALSRNKWL